MVSVQDVYDMVAEKLMEDSGLSLMSSEQEFLRMFGETIVEFMSLSKAWKVVYTQMVRAGIDKYIIPEEQIEVDEAFIDGRLLDKESQKVLNLLRLDWRKELDVPRVWYMDGLPVNTIGLYPNPNYTGTEIQGDKEPFGHFDTLDVGDRNLSTIGTKAEISSSWSLLDYIPYLPDSAAQYLAWGVLKRILSGDRELRDNQRALYCEARFQEGIYLFQEISNAIEQSTEEAA